MASHTSWLQKWLENTWYGSGNKLSRWLLMPITVLYCSIHHLKSYKDKRKAMPARCPIIVVGNITIGGTGKTPLVIYLVKLLQRKGLKPAIITRGYGGKASYWPQVVYADSDTSLVGDEAVLMATRTGVPVYAGPNRVDSVQQIQKDIGYNCDVIVSDDGMQHYKLFRDIQIAVIDGKRLLGNGFCLPAGPLREPKHRLDDCDLVVLNGGDGGNGSSKLKTKNWLTMVIGGDLLINLKTLEKKSLSDFKDKKLHAVTGIGNPQRFYTTLQTVGLNITQHDFPDHYNFSQTDLQFEDNLAIVMTEKDAVKCRRFALDKMWFLPVSAEMDNRFDKMVLERLEPLMKKPL